MKWLKITRMFTELLCSYIEILSLFSTLQQGAYVYKMLVARRQVYREWDCMLRDRYKR